MMFDTHAHVHDQAFDADREPMLARAKEAGVRRILTVGTDLANSRSAAEVAARYGLDYAIGVHPHEAKDAPLYLFAALDALVAENKGGLRAIGEMGLDYYYDHSPRERQRAVMVEQLRFAQERGFPAIFHLRDAFADFVEILEAQGRHTIRGVVHCFTGDTEQARRLVGFGLSLGIGGVVTFKNASALREAVCAVGLPHLVLETDCPYLAPVPHRGRRNEPAYLSNVAAALAELFDVPLEEIVARTSDTAAALFGA